MKPIVFFLSLLFATAAARCQGQMTPDRFREIAATPGDNTPLQPQLAVAPLWTNATATVVLTYQTGRVFTEEVPLTAKTIGGKYIVFTAQSELYHQTITSISTFDDHALARKIYGLSGETVIEATLVCDSDRKIFAETSAYGDGLQEITAGSYSDTQTTEKTMVYRNGLLYLTREVKTRPVKPQ